MQSLSGLDSFDPSGSTPQPAPLSGLPLPSLFGGSGGESLSGSGGGAGGIGGAAGGPGLDFFQLMAQLQGGGGGMDLGTAPNLSSLFGPIGGGGVGSGSFGQGGGGVGAGFGTAGGLSTGNGPQNPGEETGASGAVDPLSVIQSALGIGKNVAGLAKGFGAGGVSENGGSGVLDPTGYSLTNEGGTASPMIQPGDLIQSFLNDPTLHDLFTTGALTGTPVDSSIVQNLGSQPGFFNALFNGEEGSGLQYNPGDLNVGTNLNDPTLFGGGGGTPGMPEGGFGNYGDVSNIFGGIQSLLALAQGGKAGNIGAIANALPAAYSAASGLSQGVLPSLTSLLGPALGAAPVVGMVIQGITSWLDDQQRQHAMDSGYLNNPIKGALSSNATAGVGNAQHILDMFQNAGGIDQIPTDMLLGNLGGLTNSLLPYYATAQGPRGPIKASDTFTGGGIVPTHGTGGADQYTANFTKAQTGLTDVIQSLLGRGVSYEDIGKAPVSGDWVTQGKDLNQDWLNQSYSRGADQYNSSLNDLISQYGSPGNYSPADIFESVQGAGRLAPDAQTHASGLITSMYGGPIWAALARMGAGGAGIQDLIQQHFNPWTLPQAGGGFGGFTYGAPIERLMLEAQRGSQGGA